MKEWKQPYFLTLTVKTCYAKQLPALLREVVKTFQQITARYRKQNTRGKGILLYGIRSLECNYNPVSRTYNPHLHLILPDKTIAETLLAEWLKAWPKGMTHEAGQDCQPISTLHNGLIEVIKYGSKVFVDPQRKSRKSRPVDPKIYAAGLYNIYSAMRKMRLFERFGFDLPKKEKETIPATVTTEFKEWIYLPKAHDWQDTQSEQLLTGIEQPEDLMQLLRYGIDRQME